MASRRQDDHTAPFVGLLGMSDPSSKLALVPRRDRTAGTARVDAIGLTVDVGEHRIRTSGIAGEAWQSVHFDERLKAGAQVYVGALAHVIAD